MPSRETPRAHSSIIGSFEPRSTAVLKRQPRPQSLPSGSKRPVRNRCPLGEIIVSCEPASRKNILNIAIVGKDMSETVKLPGEGMAAGERRRCGIARSPNMGNDDAALEIMRFDEPQTSAIRSRSRLSDDAEIPSFVESDPPAISMRSQMSSSFSKH